MWIGKMFLSPTTNVILNGTTGMTDEICKNYKAIILLENYRYIEPISANALGGQDLLKRESSSRRETLS